jgi:DNA helicase-2/ATP-dependent DNA helicase PcrA
LPIEENFRSTARILGIAGRVIELNSERIPKTIRPSEMDPPPPRVSYRCRNAPVVLAEVPNSACALGCAFHTVKTWLAGGVAPHEIAVLSRINPEYDPEAALLARLEVVARRERIPVASPRLSRQVMRSLAHWVGTVVHARSVLSLSKIIEPGMTLNIELPPDVTPRILKDAVTEALDRGITSVEQWGRDLRLACADRNETMSQPLDGLVLKTIHTAKGEEYRRVIVLHLGRGHLPHPRCRNVEEERRLLYVAMTRGEEEVLVTGESGNPFVLDLLLLGGDYLKTISWSTPLDERSSRWPAGPVTDFQTACSILGLNDDFDPAQVAAELNERYQPIQETSVLAAFQKWSTKGRLE